MSNNSNNSGNEKKFIVVSPKNRSIYNFRGDLIRDIKAKGYTVIATGPNKENFDKVEELGIEFRELPMRKNGLNPVSDLKYLKGLKELFLKEKPEAVFCYTIKPVIYGSIAAKKAGIKSINVMIPGAGYTFTAKTTKAKMIKKVACMLYRYALKRADRVIFQNPDDRDLFLSEKLLDSSKCRLVNGSGVNMSKYTPTPLPERTTFFMLSRVMFSKGIREYLAACDEVKKEYPDVRFMLLGAVENIQDSLSRDDLQSYIDRGVIEHFGETVDVTPYYTMCSVYVLPSYREGTPRTVLEAMAMGRPIITTDAPGCRETVKDGVNGFLVPIGDSKALAEKMRYFIKNPDAAAKMGAESYKYCAEKYDVKRVNEMMIDYFGI